MLPLTSVYHKKGSIEWNGKFVFYLIQSESFK